MQTNVLDKTEIVRLCAADLQVHPHPERMMFLVSGKRRRVRILPEQTAAAEEQLFQFEDLDTGEELTIHVTDIDSYL